MTASAKDLTTVAAVVQFQSLQSSVATADAALLQALVTSASVFVATYCSREFVQANYRETRNGAGTAAIATLNFPISYVAQVTIDGQVIPPSTGPLVSGYVYDDKSVRLRGCYEFCRGAQNVTIAYTAGFPPNAIPEDLAQAVVEIVTAKYKRRQDLQLASRIIDGQTITFNQSDVPPSAKTVLGQYATKFRNPR
jgi:hypothetical protein